MTKLERVKLTLEGIQGTKEEIKKAMFSQDNNLAKELMVSLIQQEASLVTVTTWLIEDLTDENFNIAA